MNLNDGVYYAHLAATDVRLSASGNPVIVFLWQLDGAPQVRLKSFVGLRCKDGSPNLRGIALVRKWARGWDGADPYWFGEHLALAKSYPVALTVARGPAWNDPSKTVVRVKWVNPVHVAPAAAHPTMADVWRTFCARNESLARTDLEAKWFALVDAHRPDGRDVDQFSGDDWQRILNAMN